MKLAILQRVITPYRMSLFRLIAERDDVTLRVFHGDDLPGTKVRNAADLTGVDTVRLETRFLRLGGRVLPWHRGLYGQLARWSPDSLVCEGESHLLGYLVASLYRRTHRDCRLVHWSLGGLPGVEEDQGAPGSRLKRILRSAADRRLVYSSFGRERLIDAGDDPGSIVVGVNVSDTRRHLDASERLEMTRSEARRTLGLPERFTVLAIGAMDANKRVDLLLDTAARMREEEIQFVVLGAGGLFESLRERATREGLEHVHFPGRVREGLDVYYRAGDALLLPGRGGMVISEAMAHALPVVVHEADGTEYDLVEDGVTGLRCAEASGDAFAAALRRLVAAPEQARRLGEEGQRRVRAEFTLEHLAEQVLAAARPPTSAIPSTGVVP